MNPRTYHHTNHLFDKIISFLDKKHTTFSVKKGGTTQPYKSYKRIMDNIFQYFNIIQLDKDANEEKYAESVADLEKECDCEKYKCKGEPLETTTEFPEPNEYNVSDREEELDDETSDDREPTDDSNIKLIRKEGLIE